MDSGLEPQNIDKEFLRLWFVDNCDPYNDETLPDAPEDLVAELSSRYIYLYETITGGCSPSLTLENQLKIESMKTWRVYHESCNYNGFHIRRTPCKKNN